MVKIEPLEGCNRPTQNGDRFYRISNLTHFADYPLGTFWNTNVGDTGLELNSRVWWQRCGTIDSTKRWQVICRDCIKREGLEW